MAQKKPSARMAMMDLLARRDYSETELRSKLARKYDSENIDAALEFATNRGWLLEPSVQSKKVAESLNRRGKGVLAINQTLEAKGLPDVKANDQVELEKALRLAETKMVQRNATAEKVARFLLGRGFDPEIVEKVIYEKF